MPRVPLRRLLRPFAVALIALAPVVGVLALAAPPAQAATPGSYLVTFVARSCPTYQDITANLARNNIQESLQDLGGPTLYTTGQPISPSVEEQGQPLNNPCVALPGWQFTFGNGINGKTPNTNLSRVSNPVSPPFTTQASTPLLDTRGNPTGSNLTGAVTTTLTAAQVTQAANHQLWVQGGTPTSPLGTIGNYGFGALRCAIDNLNGDNVEWVGFPSGQTHVFCYYYAVTPPLPAATVKVVKQLGQGAVSPEVFRFRGSISYNAPNGDFEVSTANPITFVRSSQTPWNFREIVPSNPNHPADPPDLASPDFNFASVTCTSTLGTSTIGGVPFSAGAPYVSTTDPEVANLVAGAGDAVTCTYVDNPNVTELSLFKQSVGGIGGPFPITVTPPAGIPQTVNTTTLVDGVPVLVGSTADAIPVGGATYDVSEQVPTATPEGSWASPALECNGATVNADPNNPLLFHVQIPQSVPPPASTPFDCLLTNTFVPTASITLTKTTTGTTGTTEFAVVPVTSPSASDTADPVYSATTTQAGVPATATQVSGDYSLDALDLGQYSIVESGPDDTPDGTWAPVSITCDGTSSDPTSSDVLVTLSTQDPHVTCAFTNAFTATPPTTTTTTTTAATTTTTEAGGVAATDTGTSGGGLAMTGEDVRLPIGIAGVLALTGTALLLVDRNRRRRIPVVASRPDDHPST